MHRFLLGVIAILAISILTFGYLLTQEKNSLQTKPSETLSVFQRPTQSPSLISELVAQPVEVVTPREQWSADHPETAASQCPIKTHECIPCRTDEQFCRYEPGKTTGYLGWACQNNNPGNIRYSAYRSDLITANGGPAPCGERESVNFMIFSTYGDGKEALRSYVRAINNGQHSAYPECGNCTLLYFFSKYAPAGDQNDPNSYTNKVATRIGVTAQTKLNWVVANKLNEFIDAIQWHEGWFAVNPTVRENVQKMLYQAHEPTTFLVRFRSDTTSTKINWLQEQTSAEYTRFLSTGDSGNRLVAIGVMHEGHLEDAMIRYGSDLDVMSVSPSYQYSFSE